MPAPGLARRSLTACKHDACCTTRRPPDLCVVAFPITCPSGGGALDLTAHPSDLKWASCCSQAEYCFTAEGTDKHPTAYSLRGLDAAVYYRSNGVLNCGHAVVRSLIVDSLKHWALHHQVDGFCFVNAETVVQGEPHACSRRQAARGCTQEAVLYMCEGTALGCAWQARLLHLNPGCAGQLIRSL